MEFSKKRLLVISHKQHKVDNNNQINTTGGFVSIINEFSNHFKEVVLCVDTIHVDRLHDTCQYRDNVKLDGNNQNQKYALLKKMRKIWIMCKKADIVYSMGPNNTGLFSMICCKFHNTPFFSSIDTDKAFRAKYLNKSKVIGFLKYLWNKYIIYNLIKILNKNVPVFITGDMFLGENKYWHQWVKSTHRSNEYNELKLEKEKKEMFSVIYVGRLSPEKNISTLIKAFKLLPEDNFELKIIGSGAFIKELKKLANDLSLGNIEFSGYISNDILKKTSMLNADLLVLPSLEERQGKVLLEAMASSVPVIGSNRCGIPSVINHNHNGLLFDPFSHKNLAETIKEIYKNDNLREKLIVNGYKYSKKHSLDKEVNKIIRVVSDRYNEE